MYKTYIEKEIQKFMDEYPEMTFGQIMYSIIASGKGDRTPQAWLYEVSDEDFFTAVQDAKEKENE
ncbi:hypothetical protein Phi17218_071 [Cellulophaga phage phi17:2_18]|uniref:Uncharacterized protein n=2 Tax=Lightbulbvirus Cba172 TaxID=1918525 RepID=R9ZWM3_9CAUD|nr:hypothetical protein Phi17:2_gp071 [Cellulophaga phage phi17:2]AGO47604.1 hypothetical protein Phi17:2_gp071 [Cellulophaga phage phi17:2]ALO80474.1 hypothetical protein Phi17218_071 [Cellulophaga phage phi17:2_18]